MKLIRYKNWKIKNLSTEMDNNMFSRIPLKFKGCIHAKQQYHMSFISGLVEKLAGIHELTLLISASMSQLLLFPLHLDVSRKETPFTIFTEFIETFFSLSTFSQRFGSGPPHQYLENKNHETLILFLC